ncbi:MAG: (2Fe-2S) ferredoxin domain-containing protein [Cyanobacteriota bacterium]
MESPSENQLSSSQNQQAPSLKRRCVSVCQYRSCERSGSAAVLAAFREANLPGVLISASDCMGQCASGPTVRVTPDNVWYCRVKPEDVGAIATRHLQQDEPVERLLHPRFHPRFDFAD